MNQEELAYLVGTARQTVSSWERDVFMPDSANLLKLAEALRTSVAYLMGEVLDPDAPEKSKDCAGAEVVISHCENMVGAGRLKEQILADLPVKRVDLLACRGLTSFYAMEKGLIIGY